MSYYQRFDHLHAVFADGYEIECPFIGLPEDLEDTKTARRDYCEGVVRSFAVDDLDSETVKYKTMTIKTLRLAG